MKNNTYTPLPEATHSIRIGQLISTFGPGAIVDFTDQSLMTASTEFWKGKTLKNIYDRRLQDELGVNFFKMPIADDYNGIPFVRFPEWYFCPVCREFKKLSEWEVEYRKNNRQEQSSIMKKPRCSKCKNVKLLPASILVVCEKGHIHDFPWIEWVHYKNPVCDNPKLKMSMNTGTLGIEGFKVECTNCRCKESLAGSFSKDAFKKREKKDPGKDFSCKCTSPWKGRLDKNNEESCELYPRAVQRNGLNVYYSKILSSILIPPYTSKLAKEILDSKEFDALLSNKTKKEANGQLDKFMEDELEDYVKCISEEIQNNNIENIREIVKRELNNNKDTVSKGTIDKYREDEYEAITKSNEDKNDEDFKIEVQKIEDYSMEELSKVVLVKKIREISTLVGFSRLNPPDKYTMDDKDVVSLKHKTSNWYPATEVRGEGIFIEFDQEKINHWADNDIIKKRANKINNIYNKNREEKNMVTRIISPKFILLHTLAHLIIRELSFECGYATSSIKERIYCNQPSSEKIMSGILLYTADSDAEGSLGGLVQQGKADFLPNIIKRAVSRAKWCSADPVCIMSEGQGRDSLNLAACHSCVLLPETSCEEFNVLLDRAMIVGDLDNGDLGFLSRYV